MKSSDFLLYGRASQNLSLQSRGGSSRYYRQGYYRKSADCSAGSGSPDRWFDDNILTPEPGSKDYEFLLYPKSADSYSKQIGLPIGNSKMRINFAEKWRERDVINSEELITDYIKAFMPDLCLEDILEAKKYIKNYSEKLDVIFGYG